MREVHEYIRTMRTGFTVQSYDEYLRLRKAMALFREYGSKSDNTTMEKIAEAIGTSAVMTAFENLNYRERAMVSAHLGFCMECYTTHYYDKDDLDEDGKPLRKPLPEEAFIDIAIDHGLASPDTADKTYRKALGKMKKELKKKEIL